MVISETAIFVTSLLMTSLTVMVATQSSDDIGSDEAAAFDTDSGKSVSIMCCYAEYFGSSCNAQTFIKSVLNHILT